MLADDRITLDSRARADLETPGRVDPRVSAVLLEAAKRFAISIWVIQTGHSYYTAGGSVSNHSSARAVDIGSVGGELVTPDNEDAKALALALGRLPARLRPTEIGSPWEIDEPAYFTDGDHQDHLHVGFDDPAAAGDGALAVAAPRRRRGAGRAQAGGPARRAALRSAATRRPSAPPRLPQSPASRWEDERDARTAADLGLRECVVALALAHRSVGARGGASASATAPGT